MSPKYYKWSTNISFSLADFETIIPISEYVVINVQSTTNFDVRILM